MTHMPTGIIVACQSERSQHANRAHALNMLRAKIYEAEMQRREQAKAAAHGAKSDIGWGHQIRSYVLQPYKMVKDLRSGHESSQAEQVLDGDLDGFLEASLAHGLGGEA
jgi:peptide chain release factor 2